MYRIFYVYYFSRFIHNPFFNINFRWTHSSNPFCAKLGNLSTYMYLDLSLCLLVILLIMLKKTLQLIFHSETTDGEMKLVGKRVSLSSCFIDLRDKLYNILGLYLALL